MVNKEEVRRACCNGPDLPSNENLSALSDIHRNQMDRNKVQPKSGLGEQEQHPTVVPGIPRYGETPRGTTAVALAPTVGRPRHGSTENTGTQAEGAAQLHMARKNSRPNPTFLTEEGTDNRTESNKVRPAEGATNERNRRDRTPDLQECNRANVGLGTDAIQEEETHT